MNHNDLFPYLKSSTLTEESHHWKNINLNRNTWANTGANREQPTIIKVIMTHDILWPGSRSFKNDRRAINHVLPDHFIGL